MIDKAMRGGECRSQKNLISTVFVAALSLCIVPVTFATVIDYTTVANGTYPSIALGGATVTGSNNVVSQGYYGFRGLGIQGRGSIGDGSDLSLDVGETMTIDFGSIVTNAAVSLVDIDPPGNVTFSFEAYAGITSLGVFSFPAATIAPQTYDLFALSGNQNMTRFTISVFAPSAPLGLQIQGISFDTAAAVPEPASLALMGLGLAGLCFFRRKRAA